MAATLSKVRKVSLYGGWMVRRWFCSLRQIPVHDKPTQDESGPAVKKHKTQTEIKGGLDPVLKAVGRESVNIVWDLYRTNDSPLHEELLCRTPDEFVWTVYNFSKQDLLLTKQRELVNALRPHMFQAGQIIDKSVEAGLAERLAECKASVEKENLNRLVRTQAELNGGAAAVNDIKCPVLCDILDVDRKKKRFGIDCRSIDVMELPYLKFKAILELKNEKQVVECSGRFLEDQDSVAELYWDPSLPTGNAVVRTKPCRDPSLPTENAAAQSVVICTFTIRFFPEYA